MIEDADLNVGPVNPIRSQIDLQRFVEQRELGPDFVILDFVGDVYRQFGEIGGGRTRRRWHTTGSAVEATGPEPVRIGDISE